MDFILDKIKNLPNWSIYVIFIVIIFILLSIYFKIYFKLLDELTTFITLQTANDRLLLSKVSGYFILFLLLMVYFIMSTHFTILVPKLALLVFWLIALAYVKSSFNLFDHIISIKYTPHLVKEFEFISLCGEIIKENDGYYLDASFKENKIKL